MRRHIYLGLLNSEGNEPKGGGYQRVKISDICWQVKFSQHFQFSNKDIIRFPIAKKHWGTITRIAVFTSKRGSGKPLYFYDLMVVNGKICEGCEVCINSGDLKFTV